MKAILFVILLAYFTNSANASDYYFSSLSGNDSRSASEAKNPSTPWKTLSKLNSFFSSLQPGDKVYLKRGETYYGSIIVKKSGSTSAPIFIGAYGSGNRPVITGLVSLSGWVSKGGSIYEAAVNSSLNSLPNVVLLNGNIQEMGRYPNSNASNKGYLNFEAHSGKTSITDYNLSTSTNWTGAELVTRPRHWILNRSKITGQSGQKISYSTNSPYEPYQDYGYFIQNSLKTLDKSGEWYYNASTKKLSIHSGSGSPSSVQVSTVSDLISSSNYSNVTFDNLTLRGCNEYGFFINNGSNLHIQNCDVLFSGVTAVLVHGHTGLHVENCTISNSCSNGIDMEYSVFNAVLKNNKITNTALIPGLIQNGEGMGLAMYSNGDGATIEGNEIRRTGFIGVTFYGNNVTIKNNLIDSFCFVKDDGGGLYSHGGSVKNTNRKLTNNIIMHGVGAGPGTDRPEKNSTSGIYLDANTVNVDMQYNSVTTCFQGIFIQSTTGAIIKNNILYDNNRQLTVIQRAGSNQLRNSNITDNTVFARSKDQYTLYVMSNANDIGSFGTFDYNYYARPVDDKQTIFNTRISGGKTINEAMDLSGWQNKYGKDSHSKKSPLALANTASSANESLSFQYNASGSNKSVNLNGSFIDVTGKKYSSSMILQPYTSIVLIKTGSSSNKAPTVNISSPVNNKTYSAPASISITASAADADGSVSKVEFYNGSTLLGSDNSSPYSYTWSNVQAGSYAITAKATDNAGASTISSVISVIVSSANGSTPPSVNLTSPVTTSYSAPASITLSATASDDGSISKVEFFNGSSLLKSESSAPYTFTWSNVPAGTYSLSAKATDDDGLVGSSSVTVVTVGGGGGGGNQSPTVSMTVPVNNANYAVGATVPLSAVADDADGSIAKVLFYNGSTLLKTEINPPYDNKWVNVPAGSYTITARAIDNDGAQTISAPIHITVGSQTAARGSSSNAATAQVSSAGDAVSAPSISATDDNPTISGKLSLSQPDLSNVMRFKLLPNPAVTTMQIYFDGLQSTGKKATLTIYNAVGAILKKYPVTISGKNINVDVSPLSAGIYILDLSGENFKISRRFTKVK